LATDDTAGGAAGSVYNAVAEVVGADSVNAVNGHNQLVGSQRCGGALHAFMRDDSGVHDLLADEDDVHSVAHDINDGGMVVGEVGFEWLPTGTLKAIYPFVWQDGVTTVLSDLPGARATAVNDHEQVLIAGENGVDGAFLWESGTSTHLGTNLSASAINDLGQVVGTLYEGVGMQRGFIWADGVITELPLLRAASAINDSGQIAGLSSDGMPVLMDGASIVELPARLGEPVAITPDGTVLGRDYVYTGGVLSALSGRVGSNSFEEVEAHGINADHVIVGSGWVLTFSGSGPCHFETCERWTDHAVVWKDGCFAACCGEGAGGAGGAGGEAGAGTSQDL
jgi:probable HAF family extracellular repeat protein